MTRRRWYTGMVLIPKTGLRTFATFRQHRLTSFIPLVLLLLAGSVVFWFVNAIAPLAPFVYSLF